MKSETRFWINIFITGRYSNLSRKIFIDSIGYNYKYPWWKSRGLLAWLIDWLQKKGTSVFFLTLDQFWQFDDRKIFDQNLLDVSYYFSPTLKGKKNFFVSFLFLPSIDRSLMSLNSVPIIKRHTSIVRCRLENNENRRSTQYWLTWNFKSKYINPEENLSFELLYCIWAKKKWIE